MSSKLSLSWEVCELRNWLRDKGSCSELFLDEVVEEGVSSEGGRLWRLAGVSHDAGLGTETDQIKVVKKVKIFKN